MTNRLEVDLLAILDLYLLCLQKVVRLLAYLHQQFDLQQH
nr:MAG TPA: hypothetical protein [Caudoviricetes sp.]